MSVPSSGSGEEGQAGVRVGVRIRIRKGWDSIEDRRRQDKTRQERKEKSEKKRAKRTERKEKSEKKRRKEKTSVRR